MYAAVHAGGPTTPARFAMTASRYGYDGLVLCGGSGGWDPDRITEVRDQYDLDVVAGAVLDPDDRSAAGGAIASTRPGVEVLCVVGGSTRMNRFVAQQDRVDVLSRPLADGAELPHTVAKDARDHGVYVELNVSDILRTSGEERSSSIRALGRLYDVIEHYEVPYVVSAHPSSHLELRAWRELRGLGEAIGIPGEAIERGLAGWGEIVERSRRTTDDRFIEPGVRRESHEADDR